MAKPLKEYLAEAEGREWTAADTEYVLHVFDLVERLAEQIIEKRTLEFSRPLENVR